MKMFGRRYHIWDAGQAKTDQDHIKAMAKKIDRLECIVTELAKECGYAIAIEDFDSEYCSLVKVGSKTTRLEKE